MVTVGLFNIAGSPSSCLIGEIKSIDSPEIVWNLVLVGSYQKAIKLRAIQRLTETDINTYKLQIMKWYLQWFTLSGWYGITHRAKFSKVRIVQCIYGGVTLWFPKRIIVFLSLKINFVRGDRGSRPPEKSQNIGFHSNTGLDPLKNHKAIKPVFNVEPSSAP